MLHLLIDTCVWLDLAKDHRQMPVLAALATMVEANEAQLILSQIIVDEFARNKDRVIADSKRSLASHFRLVRDALMEFGEDAGREAAIRHLNDVDHRIATGGEATNEAMKYIEHLFAISTKLPPTDPIKVRAANRAIKKIAPFHRQRNSIDDAILIETYSEAATDRIDTEAVYAFVTHNIHDFSQKGGDTRNPHEDLAALFDSPTSRYVTNLAALLSEYAEDLMEEVRFEREYVDEPRKLSELVAAEQRLFQQIWYGRHWNLRAAIEDGAHRVVPRLEWENASREQQRHLTVEDIWTGALAAAARTEQEIGIEHLGPWTDFEWGMLNGKLSAIRWVLGDEWDMLDT